MGSISKARRKAPPCALKLSIRDAEKDDGQDTPMLLPETPTTVETPVIPTTTQSPPPTPTKTSVQTTTRMVTSAVESPTATYFVTIPIPQTITLNAPQTITAQPIQSSGPGPQTSVVKPGQGAKFTSTTGIALLAGLGSLAGLSVIIMASIIIWRKQKRKVAPKEGS